MHVQNEASVLDRGALDSFINIYSILVGAGL